LERADIVELERVVGDTAEPLRLDLTELLSTDRAALTFLNALHTRGISQVEGSRFIRLLLGIETSRAPPRHGPTPRKRKT
jgi:hypothetical protein